MRIVINTPAGNIGRAVANQLFSTSNDVVIISRNPAKVRDFVERGATLVEGSIDDPVVLDRAFDGADELFWLTPLVFDQANYLQWARRTGECAAEAARSHKIQCVVLISSVGAQHESGVGPISCCAAIERAFAQAVPNVTSLRAGSFMENYLTNVGMIAATGTIFSPHPSTKKFPIVATRDIADKAVAALQDLKWKGFRTIGVHGPEDLSQLQAVEIISEGIGRQVNYVEVTVEQARNRMLNAGMPATIADLLGDMYTGFRAGLMEPAELRSPQTTTKTSLLEFSRQILRPAVEAARTPAAMAGAAAD